VSAPVQQYRERYREAFSAYLREPGEERLRDAYELGRTAVRENLGALDLAAVHHEVLAGVLSSARDHEHVAAVAGDFFVESLSAFEMVQRVLREARDAAVMERHHAAILRRLSTFLADTSLALGAADSLEEVLQLVAEHARELTGAAWCTARLEGAGLTPVIEALATASDSDPDQVTGAELATLFGALRPESGSLRMTGTELSGHPAQRALAQPRDEGQRVNSWLAASLTALDGRNIGLIQVFDKQQGSFTELDEAMLVQLAQMASASVERTQLYSSRDSPVEHG